MKKILLCLVVLATAVCANGAAWLPDNPVTDPNDTTIGALPWEDAANWNDSVYPGDASGKTAYIHGGIATLSTQLGYSLGDLRVCGDGVGVDGALNIEPGAFVQSSAFSPGWGALGKATINQTGGTLEVTGATQLSRDTGGDTVYNITDGWFHMGNAASNVGRGGSSLVAELNIMGGEVTTGDAAGDYLTLNAGSTINVSGGTFETTGDIRNNGTLHVSGSDCVANIGWYYKAQAGSTTKFTFDADGVTPLYLLLERVTIDSTATLIVDVTGYNIANGDSMMLIDYGRKNLTGTWGTIQIIGGTGNIDYNFGGFNQVYITDITVDAVSNFPPVVYAGKDKDIWMDGATAVVDLADASVFDDGEPNGMATTHTWSLVSTVPSGLATPLIDAPTSLDTAVTFYEAGSYVLALDAFDTDLYGSDTVTVTVHETMCDVLKLTDHYVTLEGDLNDDCKVSLPDFAIMSQDWFTNMDDFDVVIDNWLNAKTETDLYARTFTPPPPVGQHPRVLFNAEDLPAIKDRIDNTVFGQALWNYMGPAWFTSSELVALSELDLSGGVTASHVQTYWVDGGGEGRNIRFFTAALKGVLYDDTASRDLAINAIVNFAKIVVASKTLQPSHSTWADNGWGLGDAWINGGEGFALAYDLLYNDMTTAERDQVRLAIATATEGRRAWGMGEPETRIISNWAMYNANLVTMLLAIEGEPGYDEEVYNLYADMAGHYFNHAIYLSGAPGEDGYVQLALREGSTAMVAFAKRGLNLFRSQSYTNLIGHTAQALEPFPDGNLVGHSAGGGISYANYWLVQKYAWPGHPLADYNWHYAATDGYSRGMHGGGQGHIVGLLFGMDFESDIPLKVADVRGAMDLTAFFPRRGLQITRSDWSPEALYMHFDARPDAYYMGHDNADRGSFTMSALGRTWVPDDVWNMFGRSVDHSLVHIDGFAEAYKAPSVKFLEEQSVDEASVGIADLKYAYDWQWSPPWPSASTSYPSPWEHETNSPQDLGWPGDEPWLPDTLYGLPDFSFAGSYMWRQPYNVVEKAFRTVVLARELDAPYSLIIDDIKKDASAHNYQWYLHLEEDLSIDSVVGNDVILKEAVGDRRLLVRFIECGGSISAATDYYSNETLTVGRLIVTTNTVAPNYKVMLFPHMAGDALPVTNLSGSTLSVTIGSDTDVYNMSMPADGRTRFDMVRNSTTVLQVQ